MQKLKAGYLLYLFTMLSLIAQTQNVPLSDLQKLRSNSWYKAAYRVPADSILAWQKKNVINLNYLQTQQPFWFGPDSVKTGSVLPVGHYVWVNSQFENLTATTDNFSQLVPQIIDKNNRKLLLLYRSDGGIVDNAVVTLDGKKAVWEAENGGYLLPAKKVKYDEDKDLILVAATPGDTLLLNLNLDNNNYQDAPKDFKDWILVKQIRVLGKKISNKFKSKPDYAKQRKQIRKQQYSGFVVLNKPLYKVNDTLRFKAWLTNAKGKPIVKSQKVSVQYRKNGNNKKAEFGSISASTPGSFFYSWPLPDSIPMDTRFTLEFLEPKKFNRFSSSFSTEAYTLPEISKFDIKAASEEFMWSDSMAIYLDAKDVNGLPLPDGKVTVLALAQNVEKFYGDILFVADTLWQNEINLSVNNSTEVWLPAKYFPKADFDIKILASLKNASNDVVQAQTTVKHYYKQRRIAFIRKGEKLLIQQIVDGKSESALASIYQSSEWLDQDTLVRLPFEITLHDLATDVDVDVLNDAGKVLLSASYETNKANKISLSANSNGDSIGFICSNPLRLPIWLSVTKGSQLIWSVKTNEDNFNWHQKVPIKQLYKANATYIQDDEERTISQPIAVMYSRLLVKADVSTVVEPGAKDTLKITVSNYKGQPVANANLTAMAQNTQLKNNFVYPNLPYKLRFSKNDVTKMPYKSEIELIEVKTETAAKDHKIISKQLGLDSMLYYKWLFNTSSLQVTKSKISTVYPEVSVYAMEKGRFVPIFITYLNNKPIDHNWHNVPHINAISTFPGFAKITIRTRDAEISTDSIYLQPHYKHNIFINLDGLAQNSKFSILPKPDSLLNAEKRILARHFIEIEGDGKVSGSWIWSGLTKIQIPSGTSKWIAGPFEPGFPINVWKGSLLNFSFPFEPGYRYRLSQQITRLEKVPFLSEVKKLRNFSIKPSFADTTNQQSMPPNVPIVFDPPFIGLKALRPNWQTSPGNGTLKLDLVTDTIINYTVLLPVDVNQKTLIFGAKPKMLHDIPIGFYRVLLIDKSNKAWLSLPFKIFKNGLTCVRYNASKFELNHPLAMALYDAETLRQKQQDSTVEARRSKTEQVFVTPITVVNSGTSSITGRIIDKINGDGLPEATIMIKNSQYGVTSNENGYYSLSNLAPGKYTLSVAYVGYQTNELVVITKVDAVFTQDIQLQVSKMALDEVVVVGYGTTARKSLTGSVITIGTGNLQLLEGKLAGVEVGASTNIRIRGAATLNQSNGPLYVVDGVPMVELPANLDPNNFETTVLKDNVATSLYGSRASNGVILISTGRSSGPVIRSQFRDYAYWQPEVLTNKQGQASVPIVYPDNLTNWQHMIYAAATKGRYGSAFAITKAFKALQGLLVVPAFVLEGDTVSLIGKAMNYGNDAKVVSTSFTLGSISKNQEHTISANGFLTDTLLFAAPASPDTLRSKYVVSGKKGNQDGEERSIPVLPVGMLETKGQFFVLSGDTSVTFSLPKPGLPFQWYAENNLLNILEKDLDALRNYPQACMEQTANKMWGLLMLRQIKKATQSQFKYEKNIEQLQDRLLQYQSPSGGWAWWEGGNSNLYITTKVLQALKQTDSSLAVKKAIRNGFLFLQNQLPTLPIDQKLEALYCLSEGGHIYPYQFALDSIPFDTLTTHQQWQLLRIKQNVGLPYQFEINKLWTLAKETFTGGLFWGEDSWYWYRNIQSTMVVACKVVASDSIKKSYLPKLHQYLLYSKKQPNYANTVEQAEITAVLLEQNARLWQKSGTINAKNENAAKLYLNDKMLDTFPTMGQSLLENNITLRKTGPGILFAGISQQWWNRQPLANDSLFIVKTTIISENGQMIDKVTPVIKTATPFTMKVTIEVKKQAEFVQISIPIPAGAVYNGKPNNSAEHREYLKDKMLIYIEKLPIGKHEFSIPLKSKFQGVFTINPAKVEMMYFPMFSGNEGLKKLKMIE